MKAVEIAKSETTPDNTRPVALVTGASGGIGLALARLLAADKTDLVLVARSAGKLADIARELCAQHGVRCEILPVDLAKPDGVDAVMSGLQQKGFAGVDILINNAGFGVFGEFAQSDLARELEMVQLNIATLVALTKKVLPSMVARGRGRVLNVASTGSFQAVPLMAVYAATKAFVLSFSEAIADELRGSGVTVTALCPGPTDTGFVASAKMESSRLFKAMGAMSSLRVAEVGYRAMVRGQRLVIAGFANKASVVFGRLAPRRLVAAVTRRLMARRA